MESLKKMNNDILSSQRISKKTDKPHLKAISFPGINEIKKLITEKGCRNSLFSRFIIYALYFMSKARGFAYEYILSGKRVSLRICVHFFTRACLKNALCQLHVTICGRFSPNEGGVAGYGNRMRRKYTAKWGVQVAWMIFKTRSSRQTIGSGGV